MTGWLLDINVLLGFCWKSHADHAALLDCLLKADQWATCPITETGFMRISMTIAYQSSFEDARKSLATLRRLKGHTFVSDDVGVASLPTLASYKDVTDAHLVTLAKRHGMKLATVDMELLKKSWAAGVSENPLVVGKTWPSDR